MVAECLYRRAATGIYYAWVKRGGKKFKRSLKTTDRKIADRKLRDFRNSVGRLSESASASRITFRTLAAQWLKTLGHLKPSSLARRETSVGQLNGIIGESTIQQITATKCDEWAARRGQKLKASTYNNERDTLRAVMDYAVREGLLLVNPAKDLSRRKQPRVSIRIPSHAEFATLIQTLRQDPRSCEAAALVQLLAFSGMRLGEGCEMRWRDINFDAGRFTVTGGESGTKNHETREVPLFPVLRIFLERLREERQPEPQDLVVRIKNAKRSMEYACRKAELEDFTHHTMRHYFASNAIEKGVDFKTIAAWLGHKDGGLLAARTYGHLRDPHSYEMAKLMTFAAP